MKIRCIPEIYKSGVYSVETDSGYTVDFDVLLHVEYDSYKVSTGEWQSEVAREFIHATLLGIVDPDGEEVNIDSNLERELEEQVCFLLRKQVN